MAPILKEEETEACSRSGAEVDPRAPGSQARRSPPVPDTRAKNEQIHPPNKPGPSQGGLAASSTNMLPKGESVSQRSCVISCPKERLWMPEMKE